MITAKLTAYEAEVVNAAVSDSRNENEVLISAMAVSGYAAKYGESVTIEVTAELLEALKSDDVHPTDRTAARALAARLS